MNIIYRETIKYVYSDRKFRKNEFNFGFTFDTVLESKLNFPF